MSSRTIVAIAWKDIVDALRNRYLLIALLTPLLVTLAMRIILPGINNLTTFTIVLHDPGNSRLLSKVRSSSEIKLVEVDSPQLVSKRVENSKAIGGLVIPVNFDEDVDAGKQPELLIYVNNKQSSIEQATFRQLLERLVLTLVKVPAPAHMVWIDVAKQPGTQAGGLNLEQMLLPLLLLMTFAMTGALVVPLLLVEEKEKRTLEFLSISPASQLEIITGKALTGMVYGLLIAGLVLAFNHKLIGNWPMTLLSVVVGLVFLVGVGLFMGSLFQNTMQVNTWAGIVLLVLLTPSFPSLGVSSTLETVQRLIPTYYFVEAIKLSLVGTPSTRIWGHLGMLSAVTLLAFFAATWGLRRQQN